MSAGAGPPRMRRPAPAEQMTETEQSRMRYRLARRARQDRGAAAVEFALLLPLLLLLVFGIIDFGRALNAQITLTQAAREGARMASLGEPDVASGTQAAATGLSPVAVTVTSCPASAGPDENAVVRASYSFSFVTPVSAIASLFGSGFGSGMTLSATGVMPCET